MRYGSDASNDNCRLASSKKPRVGTAVADLQPNPLGTLRAVAFVGGLVAIDVHTRVNLATSELDSHESPAGGRSASTRLVTFRRMVRQIKMFTNHCGYTA
jgi:hypothetical protein